MNWNEHDVLVVGAIIFCLAVIGLLHRIGRVLDGIYRALLRQEGVRLD